MKSRAIKRGSCRSRQYWFVATDAFPASLSQIVGGLRLFRWRSAAADKRWAAVAVDGAVDIPLRNVTDIPKIPISIA